MGGWEWAILVLIALLLIGGSRLAGIGRNAGKAVRAFREETATLTTDTGSAPGAAQEPFDSEADAITEGDDLEIVDAEVIEPEPDLPESSDTPVAGTDDSSNTSDKA